MSKKAFIFPGQGAQYVGMAKDIYDNSSKAREIVEEAEETINFKISRVMFEGPADELKLTSITQPAIFLHGLLLLNEIDSFAISASAGHSLGEYTALVANNCLKPMDALILVRKRGEAMLSAGEKYPGTMAAVIGMSSEDLIAICKTASSEGIVQCANFNSPGQIVISGSVEGVNKAMELAKENGAKLVKELVVSGAFHSPLMEPATEVLRESLNKTDFQIPSCPLYTNVSAEPTSDPVEIKAKLIEQLTAPVRWEEIIKNMERDGFTELIEIGPGKVLQGLAKRVSKELKLKSIDKFSDLDNI